MKNLKKIIVATSFMKKTVTLLFLVILSINNIHSQCTTGYNGNSSTYTIATRTGQTFQVACSGLLNTIVFKPTNSNVDDLRGQNVFVGVRLRDNAGVIIATSTINGASKTDQWFNGATITANFSAANLTLIANTSYRWEVFETTDSIPLYLFGRSNTNPYSLGNLIQDNTSLPGADADGWTVTEQSSLSTELFDIKNEKIRIYPNPSNNGIFTIDNENINKIEVYDSIGKMVWTNKNESNLIFVDLTLYPLFF